MHTHKIDQFSAWSGTEKVWNAIVQLVTPNEKVNDGTGLTESTQCGTVDHDTIRDTKMYGVYSTEREINLFLEDHGLVPRKGGLEVRIRKKRELLVFDTSSAYRPSSLIFSMHGACMFSGEESVCPAEHTGMLPLCHLGHNDAVALLSCVCCPIQFSHVQAISYCYYDNFSHYDNFNWASLVDSPEKHSENSSAGNGRTHTSSEEVVKVVLGNFPVI